MAKQEEYKLVSAKNIKKAPKRQFGSNKWSLYEKIANGFNVPGGIIVKLSWWEERRALLNEKRTKKLDPATLANFKSNLKTQLKTLRGGKVDFVISESEDGTALIVEPKG